MARINVSPDPTNDPNYVNLSRGTDKISVPRPVQDNSLGSLFSGIAGVADAAIQGTKDVIVSKIKKTMTTGIDQIRDEEFGVGGGSGLASAGVPPSSILGSAPTNPADPEAVQGGAVPGVGGKGKGAPPGVAKVGNVIDGMTQAYNAGRMSESYYWGRMEAYLKQVRAQYPGFREEIDRIASSQLGTLPANSLRRSILADLDASARANQAAASADDKWVDNHRKYFTPYEQEQYAGKKISAIEMKQTAGGRMHAEWKNSVLKDAVAAAIQERKDVSETAELAASATLSNGMNIVLSEYGVQDFIKQFRDKYKNGAKPSPEDIQLIETKASELKQSMILMHENYLSSPEEKFGGKSFYDLVERGKLDAITKSNMEKIDSLSKLMTNGQFDLAGIASRHYKSVLDTDKARFIDQAQVLRSLNMINELGGAPAANTVLTQPGMLSGLVGEMKKVVLAPNVAGIGDKSLIESIKKLEGKGANKSDLGKVTSETVRDSLTIALDKDTAKPIAINTLKPLFSQENRDFLNLFSGETAKINLFTRMTSPDVRAKIVALGNQELMTSFDNWVLASSAILLRQKVQDLQSQGIGGGWFDSNSQMSLQFSPQTGQLVLDRRNPSGPNPPTFVGWSKQVEEINRVLRLTQPSLQESGKEIGPYLLGILKSQGLDLDKIDQPSVLNSLPGKIGGALLKWFTPDTFEEIGKDKGKRSDIPLKDRSALAETIGQAESKGDYTAVYTDKGDRSIPGLTGMTVGEILAFQRYHTEEAGNKSSAAGKYQIIRKTLESLVKEGLVTKDEVFNEDTQDRLAYALMERRGLSKFKSGEMDEKSFVNSLAQEWAGLPTTSGRSFWEGVGNNKATVKLPQVLSALAEEKGSRP